MPFKRRTQESCCVYASLATNCPQIVSRLLSCHQCSHSSSRGGERGLFCTQNHLQYLSLNGLWVSGPSRKLMTSDQKDPKCFTLKFAQWIPLYFQMKCRIFSWEKWGFLTLLLGCIVTFGNPLCLVCLKKPPEGVLHPSLPWVVKEGMRCFCIFPCLLSPSCVAESS